MENLKTMMVLPRNDKLCCKSCNIVIPQTVIVTPVFLVLIIQMVMKEVSFYFALY